VTRSGANGEGGYDEVPLTLEDVLHPLEDDIIPEDTFHNTDRAYIKSACQSRLRDRSGVLVMSDCLIDWNHASIRPMSPDVSVIFDVADPGMRRGTFYSAREGTWPRAVVEIVSPHTRSTDLAKIDLYCQLQIPEYVMIDQQRDDGPRSLIHRRWDSIGWIETPGDANGVLLQAANVRLSLRDERVVCFDATTGEEILDYIDLEEAHDELQDANTELQEALEASQREVREQTRGREDAERRMRDLEADLRRLRGEPPA
jgi:colicin import membrane protein